MAVSQIEEKILGRLAKLTEAANPLLSASLYQVLGLSILLSRKLYRARKLRKLDLTRDTPSLQLYHHIIWLAREGLSITEGYILPYCQDGQHGPECRVMAAKLRASLYHVFCLFHNHPPVGQLSGRSGASASPPSTTNSPKHMGSTGGSPPKATVKDGTTRRRAGKAPLRDPIPSLQSDASFVTNPYSGTATQTPPHGLAILPAEGARRTPSRPPGLPKIDIPAAQSAVAFLLPPLNFVPMAKEYFEIAQELSNSLLPVTHALRLSVSLEHAAFLWDCAKEHDRSRRLARSTIKDVYNSSEGLDDDEFADASALVQALGGMVKRGSSESTPQPSISQRTSPAPPVPPKKSAPLTIDRTIAVSPPSARGQPTQQQQQQQAQQRAPNRQQISRAMVNPERLSTVPEVEVEGSEVAQDSTVGGFSPPTSRLSSRSRPGRASSVTSAASDKASKRKLVEVAEEQARQRQRSASNASGSRRGSNAVDGSAGSGSGDSQRAHSRQPTPTEGYSIRASASTPRTSPPPSSPSLPPPPPLPRQYLRALEDEVPTIHDERREAILRTLQILSAVEQGLYVPPRVEAERLRTSDKHR